MTYIDYINAFWNLNSTQPFTLAETKVFFYLLYIANAGDWQQPFTCSNKQACDFISMSINTFLGARTGLVDREIITISTGGKNRHQSCQYTFRGAYFEPLNPSGVQNMNPYNPLGVQNMNPYDHLGVQKLNPCQNEKENEKEKTPPLTPLLKEKDKEKEKSECGINSRASSIIIEEESVFTPFNTERQFSIDEILPHIRLHEQSWIERFCMNNQISMRDFNIMSGLFIQHLENSNIKSKSVSDYIRHFNSWFLIQKEKNGRTNRATTKTERHSQESQELAHDLLSELQQINSEYIKNNNLEGKVPDPQILRGDLQSDIGYYPFAEPP